MAKGRPRKAGARRKDGRLAIQLPVPANDVVQARREAFRPFQGGKCDQQIHDPIGRAWAVGLLDGTRFDAAMLRDAGRRYGEIHGVVFARTGMAVANNDRSPRGTGAGTDKDPAGELYAKLDQLARDSGSKQRLAMRKLVLAENPDENPLWLDRLVNERQYFEATFGPGGRGSSRPWIVSYDRDRMILEQAKQALVAMVEGR
jgi:hypothetical protein